jgi:hypothetical protein
MGRSDRVDVEEGSLTGGPRPEGYGHPRILFQRVSAENESLLAGTRLSTFLRGP